MKIDRQHLELFQQHLESYYACIRLAFYQLYRSRREGRALSIPNVCRFFSRQWYHCLSDVDPESRQVLFQFGNEIAKRTVHKHYRKGQ